MSHVFHRGPEDLPAIAGGRGCELFDATGRRYLDAAGGAIVVGIGHGVAAVADTMAAQARRVAYAHGTMFTSEVLEAYAAELADLAPVDDARVYPVAGGSEAVETALKLSRAYHLARGEPGRHRVIARWGSYHGSSRGALDATGRASLRAPYLPWLGLTEHVPAPYEYRCPFFDTHPTGCGMRHAAALDAAIAAGEPGSVAAFIAEPVAGAALGAAVPPDDYWPAVAEVCRRHGVLLIVDEVMTGFGRTGRWFGSEHWGVRPDILVAAKGAASGYWPLGLVLASGAVHDVVARGGFRHGFTHSHHVVGAAVGREVLRVLVEHDLVAASAKQGSALLDRLRAALDEHPNAGDVRGLGLMVAVELVADRATKAPFPRSRRVTEAVVAAAKRRGVLLYSSTGCADGTDGDLVMFGPPFVVTDAELDEMVAVTAAALDEVTVGTGGAPSRAVLG